MGFWSNALNSMGDFIARNLAPYINDALGRDYVVLGDYYTGDHRKQLKTKPGAQDENIIQNYVGLAVDRSVSRLFRGGMKFNLPEGSDEQKEYLDKVWDLNKKEIILYQVGLHGAIYGTSYFKVWPDEVIDPYTLNPYPRLTAVDPKIIRITTDPQDMNKVMEYVIQYKTTKINASGFNEEIGHKEITRRDGEMWVVEEYELSPQFGNQWTLVSSINWEYDFPPIVHWKNLPSIGTCYGSSDIDDSINIQDKSNFVVSNTGKIIKFYAHPETIVTGIDVGTLKAGRVDTPVGSLTAITNPEAKAYNLEMSSDLASSRAFALDLRQSIFDISREVDISSMADKVGQLTNFGLAVLWSDAIDKNDTKRQLYGDAILELNRRLLVLNNWTAEQSNPGTIQWGSALPVNLQEEISADKQLIELGVVDKETVAKRYETRYGVDWETIKANIKQEQEEANEMNDNIGAEILRRFSKGGNTGMAGIKNAKQPVKEDNASK